MLREEARNVEREKLMEQVGEWIGNHMFNGVKSEDIKLALIAGALYLCCEKTGTDWTQIANTMPEIKRKQGVRI